MIDTLNKLKEAVLAEMHVQTMGAHHNRPDLFLQYGYAHVRIFLDKEGLVLMGRKEGGEGRPEDVRDEPLRLTAPNIQKAVPLILDILKTGRTCETGAGINLRGLDRWPTRNSVDHDMRQVVLMMDGDSDTERDPRPPLDLNPDYQRGAVWTKDQSSKFMGFLLEGGQPPLVFLQRYDSSRNTSVKEYWDLPVEVIDGQQRLRAVRSWMKDEIPAILHDGREIWYKETNEIDRRCLPMLRVSYVDISREERLRFYLLLNNGGTVHTDDEINHVRDLLKAEGGTE